MSERLLADALVVLHLGFIVFVLAGGLLALRYPRIAWLHLPAALWGVYVEFTGRICPLTPWEQQLRSAAGQAGYQGGFIDHYLIPVIYPAGLTPSIQVWIGAFVLVLNLSVYAVWLRRNLRVATRRAPVGKA